MAVAGAGINLTVDNPTPASHAVSASYLRIDTAQPAAIFYEELSSYELPAEIEMPGVQEITSAVGVPAVADEQSDQAFTEVEESAAAVAPAWVPASWLGTSSVGDWSQY